MIEVQSGKLQQHFGHLARAENLSTSILLGRIDGKRTQGRQRRRWTDDVEDCTKFSLGWSCLMLLWPTSRLKIDDQHREVDSGSLCSCLSSTICTHSATVFFVQSLTSSVQRPVLDEEDREMHTDGGRQTRVERAGVNVSGQRFSGMMLAKAMQGKTSQERTVRE